MWIKSIKISFLLALCFCLFPVAGINQETTEKEKQKIDIPSSVKEELHRYMGYEELLPKYVSLPYDVTMNTNVRGSFIDISYLFLIFLPILLLMGLKNNWLKLGVGVFMLLFLVFSYTTGYSAFYKVPIPEVEARMQEELSKTTYDDAPVRYIKLQISEFVNSIYYAIDKNIVQPFSGEGDSITYPLFFLLFIAAFFVLTNRLKESPMGEKALVYLGLLYCFLWLILGAGVAWYGILMMGLGLVFITAGMAREKNRTLEPNYFKYLFFAGALFWVGISYTYRLSNYNPIGFNESKGAIHQASLFYGLGKKNKAEVLDNLFPAYRPIVEEINANPEALVYRAGTFFQYFIDRNNERISHDNQLEFFNDLTNIIPDKVVLAKALKKSGYEYLILDLNLAKIDKTPDQSLMRKATLLQQFIVNNPALQLIGTDRIIQAPDGQYIYGLSGGNIQNPGTFIAFKIK